jgi:hypothetical protein
MMEKGRMQRPKRMELHEVDANGQIVGIVFCDEITAQKYIQEGILKEKNTSKSKKGKRG